VAAGFLQQTWVKWAWGGKAEGAEVPNLLSAMPPSPERELKWPVEVLLNSVPGGGVGGNAKGFSQHGPSGSSLTLPQGHG
jgi:hypothetical protein